MVVLAVRHLARSPFGRALTVLRENAVAAEALGKSQRHFKLWAFAVAGGLAGLAGGMYSGYLSYISPDAFSNDINVLIFAMVLVGGAATVIGPLIGAVILVSIPAALALLPLSPSWLGPVEQIAYGLALVLCAMARADGLYPVLAGTAGRVNRVFGGSSSQKAQP
jgi:branched-chain amino acid transport system permease protein